MAARRRLPTKRDVFCNIPFDTAYERLYLALLSALLCTGQTPRFVLEIPPSAARLHRLVDLLTNCYYSVHDLSRVQLSPGPFRVPRFNLPFELGLAVALAMRRTGRHQFRLLEQRPHRLQQSLSDLNGYDPYIHNGTPDGVYGVVCDVFTEFRPFPIEEPLGFRKVFRALRVFRQERFRHGSIYTGDRFRQILVAGLAYVRETAQQ